MSSDPNSYHRPEKPPVIPRHLSSTDLQDIYQVLQRVLQDHGLTPEPPIDLEAQRKLAVQTLVQQARRLIATLVRLPNAPSATINNLAQTIEQVEREFKL